MSEFEKKIVEEVAKQLPVKDIYEDFGKSSIKSTGDIIGLVPRAINGALAPLHKWVLHKEYSIEETKKMLEIKLSSINPEEIVSPEPYIAVPALQAISYCSNDIELRNLYANLLASSMNIKTKRYVHPAYVEIIKQLSSDEAKIMSSLFRDPTQPIMRLYTCNIDNDELKKMLLIDNFTTIAEETKCDLPEQCSAYIDNLSRLKLINIDYTNFFTQREIYNKLFNHSTILTRKEQPIENDRKYKDSIGYFYLTQFGKEFCTICIE